VVTGGAGADRFIYKTGDLSTGETITDFHHADVDKINLTAIDAVSGGANKVFAFIGQSAFSGVAGQLHYVVEAGWRCCAG
jgi:Ca2+-binding RTX toxin-like protein